MLFALSTGHKIGLAGTGCLFIAYSLVSAFILPARWPNFPGKHVFAYVVVSVVMFGAMMSAVFVFGKESGEAKAAVREGAEATTTTATTTTPGSTTPPQRRSCSRQGGLQREGTGCAACHTFTPAGSSGKVGPDLDNLADYAAKAGEPIDNFTRTAITSPPASYVPPGFPTNAMPGTFGTSLTSTQLDDLVAFLTQKQ